MNIPHQTYKIDLNNINEPLTRMIESVNDKGVRYVDVELWANSQKVTLSQNCTATATFVTDGFLIKESVECAISDDLTTVIVPIDNAKIESKSGIMLVEIKITDESGNILTPPFAFKVRVKKSITEDAKITEKSLGTVSEILKEVAIARGDSKTLKEEIEKKADKAEFDAEMQKIMKNVTKNVIALTPGIYSKNGITVDVNSDNHISISGTASAYAAIDIPVKCSLESGVKYVLSTQNSKSIGDNDSAATVKLRGNNADIAALTINYYGLNKSITFLSNVNADVLQIAVAAGKTVNVECDVQLEKGEEYTEFISPNSEKNYILNLALANGSISEKNLDYELQNKTSKIPNMTYLYVSNDYTSTDEGFGIIKFNSIIAANESITDNNEFNRYTIIVKSGTYNEFETRYAGSAATELEGIITKDYVYYESENINNPSECVLTWDGAYGYEAGALTNEMAVKKCIFHVVGGDYHERGMHTHIKGFTIKSKNTRYGLHKESGGYGRNVDWLIENCIIEYGGRPDVVNGSLTPVVGMGMSPFEVGEIKQCDIKYSDGVSGTRAINCHDNAETSLYKNTPAVIVGAKLNIKDCNFNNKIVGLSVKGEATSDTDYVARLENNAGVSDVEITGWKVI